jgi:hypothetical protein
MLIRTIIALVALLASTAVDARSRGIKLTSDATSFNGGKFQINPNFAGIGGDYPFVNILKNTSGSWSYRTNSGTPAPDELDAYGYPLPGAAMFSLGTPGVYSVVRTPAQAYVGGNCPNSIVGTCYSTLVNGKGTNVAIGTPITATASSVTTGAITTINFASPQDFRAGMEVPISGTTGVTATNGGGGNITAGGTAGAWTVCAAGLTTTSIRLCLNDQTTALTTTGTAGGTTTVTYGRDAVGVASGGRIVSVVTGSPDRVNPGISAQDATTPITYRNGIDGLAIVLTGSEEVRYEQWRAGTCPGGYNPKCQFNSTYLAKLTGPNPPGVIRHLNTINTNESQEVVWADRKPAGYWSFGSNIYDRITSGRSSSFAGTTTSAKNNYSVTLGSGAPTDGQQLILSFDAASVSVANGASALITWTGHGLSTAEPFYLGFIFGGSMPKDSGGVNNLPANTTYYAITSCGGCDANNIQFATSAANALAGTAVTTSSTGSNVIAHATVANGSATLTNGSPNIAWTAHGLSVGDQVSFQGTDTLGYPFSSYAAYFVKTVPDANTITVSLTSGGATLTPAQSGTFGAIRNPTLNLNGTGAVSIKDRQMLGVGLVRTTYPLAYSSAGTKMYASFTYDGVLGVWNKRGGDTSFGTQYFNSGWPPETALELCISVGAHCWFTAPTFTIDGVAGITDYNPSLYAMVQANKPSWMGPWFEGCNENWNNLFVCTSLGKGHATVYAATAGWTQNAGIFPFSGKVSSVLGQAAWNAFGGTLNGSRYKFVIGLQTFNFASSGYLARSAQRATAADYVGQSTPAQAPYTKSAASNWATHVSPANYWTPGYYGTFVATSLAAANAGGVITGSISGNQLTVTSVRVVTSPVFGVGSTLVRGPGVEPGTTIVSGTSSPYTLDRTYTNPVGGTDIDYRASGYDTTAAPTFVDSALNNATFTGSISGGCTVSSTSGTTLAATGVTGFITTGSGNGGDRILGTGVAADTQVLGQLTGTTGKDGTYCTSNIQTVASTAMTANGVFSLPAENIYYTRVAEFRDLYANKDAVPLKMAGYEGTYSPDYSAAGRSVTDQLAAAGKYVTSSPGKATGIRGYTLDNCNNFIALGGEFCSQFNFTGTTPSTDAWSAFEDLYQPVPSPIWQGYQDINFLLKRDFDPASNDNDPMWLEKAA